MRILSKQPPGSNLLRSDTPTRHRFDSPSRRYSIKWRSQVDYRWKFIERGSDRGGGMKPLQPKSLRWACPACASGLRLVANRLWAKSLRLLCKRMSNSSIFNSNIASGCHSSNSLSCIFGDRMRRTSRLMTSLKPSAMMTPCWVMNARSPGSCGRLG